jgi:hypothetical protein
MKAVCDNDRKDNNGDYNDDDDNAGYCCDGENNGFKVEIVIYHRRCTHS